MLGVRGRKGTLSPRDLAEALGVSESSIKRWIDAGRIQASVTAGGHRRIDHLAAMKFVRDSGRDVVQPGMLGISRETERVFGEGQDLSERVTRLLADGRGEETAELLLTALAYRTASLTDLFDGPLRVAMARIGEMWQGGIDGIFVEHRATQILLGVLDQLDALLEPPREDVVAVGAI